MKTDMTTAVGLTIFYDRNKALDFMAKMNVKAYGKRINFALVVYREEATEDCGVYEVEAQFDENDTEAYEVVKALSRDL